MSAPEQDTPHQDQWVLPDPEGLAGSQDVEADPGDSDDAAAGRQVEETVAVQEQVEPAD